MVRQCAWQRGGMQCKGGVHGKGRVCGKRRHAWQRVGGMHGIQGDMINERGGVHPTGMYSC